MTEKEEQLQFDKYGRLKYHPAYHPNQGKAWTTKENIYLCKYYESKIGCKGSNIKSLSLDMGRTVNSIRSQLLYLRKAGLYDLYKNWD